MDHSTAGMALATHALVVTLINNLRGLGVFTDLGVQDLYQQVLDMLDDIGEDAHPSQRELLDQARSEIQRELDRERAYPPRTKN